jgi:hypothetical protein
MKTIIEKNTSRSIRRKNDKYFLKRIKDNPPIREKVTFINIFGKTYFYAYVKGKIKLLSHIVDDFAPSLNALSDKVYLDHFNMLTEEFVKDHSVLEEERQRLHKEFLAK